MASSSNEAVVGSEKQEHTGVRADPPTEMAEAEPEREPESEPIAPDATGYRETTDRVHMRRGPGSEHASITILDRGRIVPVLEPPRGDWVHVRHFDADGWVHGSFLRPAAPPADG